MNKLLITIILIIFVLFTKAHGSLSHAVVGGSTPNTVSTITSQSNPYSITVATTDNANNNVVQSQSITQNANLGSPSVQSQAFSPNAIVSPPNVQTQSVSPNAIVSSPSVQSQSFSPNAITSSPNVQIQSVSPNTSVNSPNVLTQSVSPDGNLGSPSLASYAAISFNVKPKTGNLSVRCSKTPFYQNSNSWKLNFIQLKLSQIITKLGGFYYNVQLNQCLPIILPVDTSITTNFFPSLDACNNACLGRDTIRGVNIDPSIECLKPAIIGTGSGICINFQDQTYTYNSKTQSCDAININCGDIITTNIFTSKKTCYEFCHGIFS